MFQLIAHRGASCEEPENTMVSVSKALEIGVDFVEIDVHLSGDGVPVVIHDHTFCRTTNAVKGRHVRESPYHEIMAFDAGSWHRGQPTDVRVPSLEDVLAYHFNGTGLMIDMKEDRNHDLSAAVMGLLEKYQVKHAYIASFSTKTLTYFMEKYPDQPVLGLVDQMDQVNNFRNIGVSHYAVDYRILPPQQKILYPDERIWTFTVDDIKIAKDLIAIGVDGIITNNPRQLKTLKEKA